MKEPRDRILLAGVVAALFILTVLVSLVTSSIVVKTLAPSATSTPKQSATPDAHASSTPFNVYTPMKIDMPQIESNLLQNSGFENGLSGWTYSDELNPDKFAGIRVFETTGVNGKAYCSRRYEVNPQALDKAIVAFAQEIPVDPRASYFFGGWVKLSNAVHITVGVREYDWSQLVGTGLAAPRLAYHRVEQLPTAGSLFTVRFQGYTRRRTGSFSGSGTPNPPMLRALQLTVRYASMISYSARS